jgi:hypothetical protein
MNNSIIIAGVIAQAVPLVLIIKIIAARVSN